MKIIDFIVLFIILSYVVCCVYTFIKVKDDNKATSFWAIFSIGYLIAIGVAIGISPLIS